jgi:hypothetical protein
MIPMIGDIVRAWAGGQLMRILDIVDQGCVAICEVLETKVIVRVAIGALVLAGFALELYDGIPVEEVPAHPVVAQVNNTPPIATTVSTIQVPPPRIIQPLRYEYTPDLTTHCSTMIRSIPPGPTSGYTS